MEEKYRVLTNKISERDFQILENEIMNEKNDSYRQKFFDEMLDLSFVDDISKEDILKSINEVGIKINTNVLMILLCRESQDMYQINGEVILHYIDLLILKTPNKDEKESKDIDNYLNPASDEGTPNKKKNRVQISTKVTTINFDKEAKVKMSNEQYKQESSNDFF